MEKAYCASRLDGAGAVINEELFVLAHCYKNNLEFVGSYGFNPTIVNHFENHYALCELLDLPLPVPYLPSNYNNYKIIKEEDYGSDVYPDVNNLVDDKFIQMLRLKFLAKNSLQTFSKTQAAVHIRRNDVKIGNTRYIPNSYYINIVKKLKEINSDIEISIFSQSNSSETFDEFEKLGCNLQLDKDLVFTWKQMIGANIFVMSKGSFSYVPALYNSNFVIFHPAWYQKLKHWHHIEDDNLWSDVEIYLKSLS